jgi:hypothetical protein
VSKVLNAGTGEAAAVNQPVPVIPAPEALDDGPGARKYRNRVKEIKMVLFNIVWVNLCNFLISSLRPFLRMQPRK